jgi:hypothetical protein
MESAMPLDVSNFTKLRREVFTSAHSPRALDSLFTAARKILVMIVHHKRAESFVMYITKDLILEISGGDRWTYRLHHRCLELTFSR